MADALLLLVVAAAVFVSTVLLTAVCLHCRNKGPLVSIRQVTASDESTEFRIIPRSQSTTDHNSIHPSSNLLPPFSPFDPGSQRRQRSFITDTESNPSYENPVDGSVYINGDSDVEDPGYIIVLPEGETPLNNQSRASTPSSDMLHEYENVPEKTETAQANKPSSRRCSIQLSTDGDEDYLNVEPGHQQCFPSTQESSDSDMDSDSDSDDSEGNYVNVNETQA